MRTAPHDRFWIGFLLARLARLVLVLLAVAVAAFAMAKMSPVDPVDAYLGGRAALVGPEQRALIAERWQFDEAPLQQFASWAANMASGEMGWSVVYNAPVADIVSERFRASLLLMALAWSLSAVLGFGLGLLAGALEGSATDRAIRLVSYVFACTPTFWVAILLLMVFSVSLGWTPVCCGAPPGVRPDEASFLDQARHLVLPVAALTLLGFAQTALHTRAKTIEILRSDFALYAFAQGATRADVVLRHGARNAAVPAITITFASLGELFGGSVLAEQVFAYPGIGQAMVAAGLGGDVPLLLAATLGAAVFVCLGNTLADVLQHAIDPRLRARGARPA